MTFRLIGPDEDLDFTVSWASWLDTDVLITGTPVWTIFPTGPTLSDQSNTTTTATTFVSSATLGVVYLLSCSMTTDAGVTQTPKRSIALRCEER